jgi:hypothetical protein
MLICGIFFSPPAALLTARTPALQPHQPLLLISIDGMKSEYVAGAEHHRHFPMLRRILAEDARASGVQGAFPSVTYPSHATHRRLVVAVRHLGQGPLRSRAQPQRRLILVPPSIQVPTLYAAANAAGLQAAGGWA